jgi:hypothetical protein
MATEPTSTEPPATEPTSSEPRSRDHDLRNGLIFFGLTLVAFLFVTVAWPLIAGDDGGGKAAVDALKASKEAAGGETGAVGASPSPSTSTSGTGAGSKAPAVTVYLLDGSGARECITTNAEWGTQIKKASGVAVRARDLGNTNQTFLQDAMLVDAMPKGKAIALIGLSVGRYTGEATEGADSYDPGAVLASNAEINHHYSEAKILSESRKQTMVDDWLAERYPVFQQTYAANQAELEKLVVACRARKVRPVLLELPINLDIVGDRYDAPRTQYAIGARALAKKYKIPYIDFVDDVGLVNTDFYDLMHLVEPGRAKWQKRLTEEVATLLDEYGMAPGK